MHDHSLPPSNIILTGNSSSESADCANVLAVCNNTRDLHCTLRVADGIVILEFELFSEAALDVLGSLVILQIDWRFYDYISNISECWCSCSQGIHEKNRENICLLYESYLSKQPYRLCFLKKLKNAYLSLQ